MLKKIACFFAMICSFFMLNTMYAEASKYDTALGILNGLEIINSSTDEFSESDVMTRLDFVVLLEKCLGVDENLLSASNNKYFYDVNPNDEFAGYIEYAYTTGITMGVDERIFGGTSPIKLNEAIAMCIRALGYDDIQNIAFNEYISVGTQIGLTDGITISYDDLLTYKNAYIVLYNMMTADLIVPKFTGSGINSYTIDNNSNYLNSKFKVSYVTDIIENTPYAAQSQNEYTSEGIVEIGNEIFYIGSTDADKCIGYKVKAYYRENDDDDKTLVWIDKSYTQSIIVPASKIEIYEPQRLEYIYNEKTKDYDIESDALTLYNGSVYHLDGKFEIPYIGYVELIDNDRNGDYDVVSWIDYKTIIVGGVNIEEGIIYDSRDNLEKFKLSDFEHYSIKDQDGASVLLGDIQNNSVLQLVVNNDKKFVDIIVVDNKIECKVESINEADSKIYSMRIGNEQSQEFNVSLAYDEISGNERIILGKNYTFLLNINGDIIASLQSTNSKRYGYLTKCYTDDFDEVSWAKIFCDDGNFNTYKFAKRVSVFNGNTLDKIERSSISQYLSNQNIPALIRYSVNTNNEIVRLEFEGSYRDDYGFEIVGEATTSYAARFKKDTNSIAGRIVMDDSTVIFAIPEDKSETEKYDVYTLKTLVADRYYEGAIGYGNKGDVISQAVVISYESVVKSSYQYVVYDDYHYAYDEDTEEVKLNIEGYVNGKKTSYKVDDDQAFLSKNFNTGDYLQLYINSRENVVASQITRYFDVNTPNVLQTGTTYPTGLGISERYDTGVVTSIYEGYSYLQIKNDRDESQSESTKEYYKLADNATYYIYDENERYKLSVGTKYDLYANGSARVFIYTNGSVVKTVIFVKD